MIAAPSLRLNQVGARADARTTRADAVRRQIADAILAHQLPPGSRLDEQALADRFGVSRTPVREALRHLVSTGLVEMRAHRGAVVASMTQDRMVHMFEVMGELEAACARFAALRMTAKERRHLEVMHQETARHVRSGDIDAYDTANLEFHATIYRGGHNDFLTDTTFAVRNRVTPFRRAQFRVLGRLAKSFAEHDAVVQAILRGDSEGAFATMRNHVAVVSAASSDYIAGAPESPMRNGTDG
jgi:DNA-binding GntR family transcriptional regulator